MAAAGHFRSSERCVVSLTASVQGQGGSRMDVRVVNLSLGGACVEAANELPAGEQVLLHLEAEDLWKPVELGARVVWVQRHPGFVRAGLAFAHRGGPSVGALLGAFPRAAFS